MIVNRQGSVWGLLRWQWKAAVFYLLLGVLAVALEANDYLPKAFPNLPLAVLGGALGIFISFRTNSAYARWWEGRQLWGRLINQSRHFAAQVASYVPEASRSELIQIQSAYAHLLRCLLREQKWREDEHLLRLLPADQLNELAKEQNPTAGLLAAQFLRLKQLQTQAGIDVYELQSFDRTLREIIDVQGGCERIKRTPMPPAYAYLATRLTQLYAVLLPLAVVHDLGLVVIPLNLLVCLAFTLINEVGRVLEDPFTLFWNGLPLTAMSLTIEVNLRQRIGETDLPAIPQPTPPGILM